MPRPSKRQAALVARSEQGESLNEMTEQANAPCLLKIGGSCHEVRMHLARDAVLSRRNLSRQSPIVGLRAHPRISAALLEELAQSQLVTSAAKIRLRTGSWTTRNDVVRGILITQVGNVGVDRCGLGKVVPVTQKDLAGVVSICAAAGSLQLLIRSADLADPHGNNDANEHRRLVQSSF